jgi:hypothetical protein
VLQKLLTVTSIHPYGRHMRLQPSDKQGSPSSVGVDTRMETCSSTFKIQNVDRRLWEKLIYTKNGYSLLNLMTLRKAPATTDQRPITTVMESDESIIPHLLDSKPDDTTRNADDPLLPDVACRGDNADGASGSDGCVHNASILKEVKLYVQVGSERSFPFGADPLKSKCVLLCVEFNFRHHIYRLR